MKPHELHACWTCVVPNVNAQQEKTKSMEKNHTSKVVYGPQPVRRTEHPTILFLLTNLRLLVSPLPNWPFHRSMEAPAPRLPPPFDANLAHEDPFTF
mmetsp:Transcript_11303/g.69791  ORF Transcript_11303/g.69791 Transcript_11303/m.69791 type:complete len:97 (+) Transcript_11303:831-1121(+)